jgi:hypothetical protein
MGWDGLMEMERMKLKERSEESLSQGVVRGEP